MKRILLALLLLAPGCTSTVVLGTLTTDGGTADLADMSSCTVCDQAFSPTDIALEDLGDAFPFPVDLTGGGGVNDLSH
jgi:hypothetical protein